MIPGLFVLIGAFSLAAQTIVLREYLVLHGGNELALALFYGSWFGWIAVAALTYRLVWRERAGPGGPAGPVRRTAGVLSILLLCYPIALLGQVLLIQSTRALAGVPPTEPMALGQLAAWTLATNAPVGVVTGTIFPVGCDLLRTASGGPPGRAVGRAFVFESLGSFVGGVMVTALVSRFVPPVPIVLGFTVVLALVAARFAVGRGQRWAVLVHGALAVAALLALLGSFGQRLVEAPIQQRFRELLPGAKLVASSDTPYQRASVAKRDGQVLLLSNGHIVTTLPDSDANAMRAALLVTQPAAPRRLLLIGRGAQGLAAQLLRYPVEQLYYVAPDERAFQLAEPHLPPGVRAALGDGRVRLDFRDGRAVVDELARRNETTFDLVIVAVPDPDTAALNRYFTVDFYRTAATLLAPGGALGTRISSGEHVLGTELALYGASIHQSLGAVFDQVAIAPGEESWLLASLEPNRASVDAETLVRRYRALPLDDPPFPPEAFYSLLDPERVRFVERAYRGQAVGGARGLLNRDAKPVSYFFNLLVLGRHTGSAAVDLLRAGREVGVWLFALPLSALILLRLHYLTGRASPPTLARDDAAMVLIAFGGASIALQLLLMFAFQSRFGVLYEQLGLCGGLFMMGLAGGGAVVLRLPTRRPARQALALCLVTAALAAATPGLVAALATTSPTPARLAYYGLFLATGALSGAAFPAASLLAAPAERRAGLVGALLQAADHWGAALGAVAVGALLLPMLGTRVSATLIAGSLGGTALCLAASRPAARRRLQHLQTRWWQRLRGVAPVQSFSALSFPWPRLSYALVAVIAVVLLPAALLGNVARQPQARIGPHRLAAAVAADRFVERGSPFVHYLGYAAGTTEVDSATVASIAVTDDVEGYAGPVNLLVSVGADGVIRRVELIDSNETPAYISEIGPWLRRFEGKSSTRSFRLVPSGAAADGHDLDGLTGATITSRAVVGTVNAAAGALAGEVLGLEAPRGTVTSAPAPLSPDVIALLLGLALAVFVQLRAGRRLRTAWLAATLVVLGLAYNVQLSLHHLLEVARGVLPSTANLLPFVLLAGVALVALAFGPSYCATLCPFGAAQELLFGAGDPARRRAVPEPGRSRGEAVPVPWYRLSAALALGALLVEPLGRALLPAVASRAVRAGLVAAGLVAAYFALRRAWSTRPSAVSPPLHARARYLKYVLLAGALVGAAAGHADRVASLDPLAVAFSGRYGPATALLLVILWLACMRYFRLWCRFFCPVGALLHLGNKLGLLGRLQRPKRYARCDLGVRSVGDVDCIQCNRCIDGSRSVTGSCEGRPYRDAAAAARARRSSRGPAEGATR